MSQLGGDAAMSRSDKPRALAEDLNQAHRMNGHHQLETLSQGVVALRAYADLLDAAEELLRVLDKDPTFPMYTAERALVEERLRKAVQG